MSLYSQGTGQDKIAMKREIMALRQPAKDFTAILRTMKWALIPKRGAFEKISNQGYLPKITGIDAQAIFAIWAIEAAKYGRGETSLDPTEVTTFDPMLALRRHLAKFQTMLGGQPDPGKPISDYRTGELTWEQCQYFWYMLGDVATSLTAVTVYSEQDSTNMVTALGASIKNLPDNIESIIATATDWITHLTVAVATSTASGISKGLFSTIAKYPGTFIIGGTIIAAIYWYKKQN